MTTDTETKERGKIPRPPLLFPFSNVDLAVFRLVRLNTITDQDKNRLLALRPS